MADLLESIQVETAPDPTVTVIWMHGLGADGHDFEPVVPELGLPARPAIRFVFPHAPLRPVTVNQGHVMRAWYDIRALAGVRREDETGVRQSAQQVEALFANGGTALYDASLSALDAIERLEGLLSKRRGRSRGCGRHERFPGSARLQDAA